MQSRASGTQGALAFVLGAAGTVVLAVVLRPVDSLPDSVVALVLVLPVLYAAVAGGRRAAAGVAVVAATVFSFEFLEPTGSVVLRTLEGFLGFGVFLTVALVVGTLVANQAARRRVAEEQRDEIERMHERFLALADERERLAEEARRVEILEEIDRQRAALLRSVSHDLRSPLVTIRGVSSELRDGAEFDEPTRMRLLDLVVSESERLDRIVANLLSLSRIEAGNFAPDREPVEIDELVRRSVARLGRLFAPGALRIEVAPAMPVIEIDPTQVDQVLANLLENAARHTPLGTPVVIEAGIDGDAVRITVRDDGPGWDPARPGRSALRTSGEASHGIGLTICAAIVGAHGGTFELDAGVGRGTRASVTLPQVAPPGGESSA